MALLAVRQTVTNKNDPATTVTLTFGSTTAGSLLLAFVGRGVTNSAVTWTPPSGWTLFKRPRSATSVDAEVAVFTYPNNPGGVTTAVFTESLANQALYAIGFEILNAELAVGVDTAFGSTSPSGSAATVSLQNLCQPTMVFAAYQASNNGSGGNPVFGGTAGYTVQQGTGTRDANGGLMVQYKNQPTSGAITAPITVSPSAQMEGVILCVLGPPVIVQTESIFSIGGTAPTVITTSLPATAQGNTIILTVETKAATGAVSQVQFRTATQGPGSGHTAIEVSPSGEPFNGATGSIQVFYLNNIPGGLVSVDITQFSNAGDVVANYLEIQGLSQLNVLDGSGKNNSAGTPGTAASATTTANVHAPVMVLGIGAVANNDAAAAAGVSFPNSQPLYISALVSSGSGFTQNGIEWKALGTTTTNTADWTLSTSANWVAFAINLAIGSRGNAIAIVVPSTQSLKLSRQINVIKKVQGTGIPLMIRTRFKTLKVLGTGVAKVLRTRLKTLFFSNGGTARLTKARCRLINVAGTGVATVNRLRVQLISVIGTGTAKFLLQLNKNIFIKGTSVVGQLLAPRFRPGYLDRALADSSHPDGQAPRDPITNVLIVPQPFFEVAILKKLAVAGTGAANLMRSRLRTIFVAGTHVASLNKIRSVLIAVAGTGIAFQGRRFSRLIAVVGTGAASMVRTRLRSIVVAGTGTAKMLRARLRLIRVVGTGIASLTLPRFIQIIVAGTGVATIFQYKFWHILIQVVGGGIPRMSRRFTKILKFSGSGVVSVLHPRLLKRSIAVVGTGLMSLLHRKGTPSLAHATRFNITASGATQRNITVKK